MLNKQQIIIPDWPAPANVRALVTTRLGGVSEAPYDSLNVGLHVGDDPAAVNENRARLRRLLNVTHAPQWLQQVHGSQVVEARTDNQLLEADACVTRQAGLPCVVMTADCLPVFFCTLAGDRVAVAHAGWRGLAAGVLEATLAKLDAPARQVMVWLGPAIGAQQFEVGAEVRQQFLSNCALHQGAFTAHPCNEGQWLADIYRLARLRLELQGVEQIYGGGFCTFTEQQRFYSYRRDGQTGRMANVVWLQN